MDDPWLESSNVHKGSDLGALAPVLALALALALYSAALLRLCFRWCETERSPRCSPQLGFMDAIVYRSSSMIYHSHVILYSPRIIQ